MNVDFSPWDIHGLECKKSQPSISKTRLKITCLKFHLNLLEANQVIWTKSSKLWKLINNYKSYSQQHELGHFPRLSQSCILRHENHTVRYHYNSQFFPKSLQKTPHSSWPRVRYGVHILLQSLKWYMQYHVTYDCIKTALNCMSILNFRY